MKKAKSLLLFIPSIENGGVEKNLYLIANYLAKTSLSVKILTAFDDKKKLFDKKIRIISLKRKNIFIKSRLIKTIITIAFFVRYFYNKDVVILSFQSNIVAILLGLIFNKKVIIRSNTSPEKYIKNNIKKLIIKFFLILPMKLL